MLKHNKVIKLSIISLVLFVFPVISSAQTIADLQAQIAQLMAQVSALQAKIQSIGSSSSCPSFTRSLRWGDRGSDVSTLQSALNSQGFPLDMSGWFGPNTASAVSKFQSTYASDILVPAGLSSPSGYAGQLTLAKLKSLRCNTATVTQTTTATTNTALQACVLCAAPPTGCSYSGSSCQTCGILSCTDVPVVCQYPVARSGCGYIQGPNYVPATNCGLVLSCIDTTPTNVPTINAVTPSDATTNTLVTIYGTNLTSATEINFYNSNNEFMASIFNGFNAFQNNITVSPDGSSLQFILVGTVAYNVGGAWQIRVLTPNGLSNNLPFTIIAPSAIVPSPITRAPGTFQAVCSQDGLYATLSWGAVSNAKSYLLRVDDPRNNNSSLLSGWYAPNSNDIILDAVQSSQTVNLEPNTQYYWWVHGSSDGTSATAGPPRGGALKCVPSSTIINSSSSSLDLNTQLANILTSFNLLLNMLKNVSE